MDFDVIGIGCSGIQDGVAKYAASVLFFPLVIGVMLVCFALSFFLNKIVPKISAWEAKYLLNTALSFLQLCFISMTGTAVVPFACYVHPTSESSVSRYPQILCGDPDHGTMQVLG